MNDCSILSTTGLKAPLQIFFWKCPLFSNFAGLWSRNSDFNKKQTPKNVYCECYEIVRNLLEKDL